MLMTHWISSWSDGVDLDVRMHDMLDMHHELVVIYPNQQWRLFLIGNHGWWIFKAFQRQSWVNSDTVGVSIASNCQSVKLVQLKDPAEKSKQREDSLKEELKQVKKQLKDKKLFIENLKTLEIEVGLALATLALQWTHTLLWKHFT